ncbi:MAG TPA: RodZ domain-containing protein [Bacteroidota bacterium]|jgi:cytoskeletal protein RodZ|nr:RodZ domain-containing protein [Bacteroidota bacterium]
MNPIKSIGEQLSAARESLGLSLEDLAVATRINLKFLREIEEGRLPGVPPTYVRAFIKACANRLNLDPDKLVLELERATEGQDSQQGDYRISEGQVPSMSQETTAVRAPSTERRRRSLLLASGIVGAVALTAIVWTVSVHGNLPVQEISLADVPNEHEASKAAARQVNDSASGDVLPETSPPEPESLILEAVARDSVWVHVVIDEGVQKEYFLPRFSHIRWTAKESFHLSVGNAGAISLTLNGRKVSLPGNSSRPATNVLLSRETLHKLNNEASGRANG